MSTTYNFYILDLDEESSPWDAKKEFYLLASRKSYESLEYPVIFKTRNNTFAKDCFTNVTSAKSNIREIEALKFLFGNMFWDEILKHKNQNVEYLLNHWGLKWQPTESVDYIEYLEYYSIHQNSIKVLLSVLSKVNMKNYLNLSIQVNQLNEVDSILQKTVIEEWITMYQTAMNKSKGVVFNIG